MTSKQEQIYLIADSENRFHSNYADWDINHPDQICLDGHFTIKQLRDMADMMDTLPEERTAPFDIHKAALDFLVASGLVPKHTIDSAIAVAESVKPK